MIKRDQLLLRKQGKQNLWMLPGGLLESGERIEDAAVHHILGVTDLRASVLSPVGLYYLAGSRLMNILFKARSSSPDRTDQHSLESVRYFQIPVLPPVLALEPCIDAVGIQPKPLRVIEAPNFGKADGERHTRRQTRARKDGLLPVFTVRASAILIDKRNGNVLTVRGAVTRMGEVRALPRLITHGERAVWMQLSDLLVQLCGVKPSLKWVGLWQDAPNNRIEFVFAASVPAVHHVNSELVEWLPARTTAFADIDAMIVSRLSPDFAADPVWIVYHDGTPQAGDIVTRYNQ